MENKAMTAREFYNAVLAIPELAAELAAYATAAIAKLDEKNANRKTSEKALAHKAENDSFKSAILATLADGNVYTAADLAAVLNVSTQKVSALARQLVEDEVINVEDYKVKGKGTVKGYSIPNETPLFEDEEEVEETEGE